MTKAKTMRPVLAACAASAICVAGLLASPVQPAQANTYSDLVNAQSQHAASVQREAQLKQQLAGASTELADKIMELDDLTNNKIVAAQDKVTQANADAATAQEEADAAAQDWKPRRRTRKISKRRSRKPVRTMTTPMPLWPNWPVKSSMVPMPRRL